MTGAPNNVVPLWPEPQQLLRVHLDPASSEDRALVHVAGEIDLSTAPALLDELTTLAGSDYHHVDIDLLHVRFCDGAGLAVLLEGRRRLTDRGSTVALHDPCPSLQRILDICGLTLDLEPRETPEPNRADGAGGADGLDGSTRTSGLRLLPPLRQD